MQTELPPAEEKKRNGPDHPTARLARAVKEGSQEAFERALQDGGDALSPSILISAARRGDIVMARALMSRGAKPETLDRRGFSAMYHAFKQNDEPMLRLFFEGVEDKLALVEAGLSGETRRGRRTLFESACAAGDARAVRLLIELADKEPSSRDFLIAASSPSGETARRVWEALSPKERQGVKDAGMATLISAARADNVWAVELALDTLGCSLEQGVNRISNSYSKRQVNERALDAALSVGALGAARVLLERGASVQALPGENPPLMTLCSLDDSERMIEGIELLARFGADPNEQGDQGRSALGLVCSEGGSDSVAKALLAMGADPNQYDDAGDTPFHRALRGRSTDLVLMLIDGGADPELRRGSTGWQLMKAGLSLSEQRQAASAREAYLLNASTPSAPASRRGPSL